MVTGNLQVWNPSQGWIGLNGASVDIYLGSPSQMLHKQGSVSSGPSLGAFKFSLTARDTPGTYVVRAQFAGDSLDNPSPAQDKQITVLSTGIISPAPKSTGIISPSSNETQRENYYYRVIYEGNATYTSSVSDVLIITIQRT
jgi:hypothetical protein